MGKNLYNKPPGLSPILIILIACLVLLGVQYGATLLSSDPISTEAYGKITSPTTGTTTGAHVKVTVETKNLEPGQYVWLAVDKPEISLCWPKTSGIKLNTKFMTTISEEDSTGSYTLSLYVVHKTINEQWQRWLDKDMHGGLPMLPDKRRLDSVILLKRS
ncbi:hypothetical protein QUF70_09220 [Desulfobacterales bacterium HSG17]|nr:hypothetical protein [Desulfobacterales bacterium HSG17]